MTVFHDKIRLKPDISLPVAYGRAEISQIPLKYFDKQRC